MPTLKSTNCNLPLYAFSNSKKYTIHKSLDYKTCENLYENRRVEFRGLINDHSKKEPISRINDA